MFRKKHPPIAPKTLVEMLKLRPDEMFVTSSYIAIWSSGWEMALFIPGHFDNVNEEQANKILQANLKKINRI